MDWVLGVAVLLGLVGPVAAIICLISPNAFRLSSRWYAIPLALVMIGTMGLAMILAPEAANDPDTAGTRVVGVVLAGLWAATAFGFHQLATSSKRDDRKRVEQLNPPRTSEQVDARRGEARRKAIDAAAPVRLIQRPIAELEQTGPIKSGRKPSRSVRARLKQDPNAPHTRVGKSARFVYVDADGVVTDRQIVNWSIAGHFIEGFCLDRKQIRTFRLDRIDEWIDAE